MRDTDNLGPEGSGETSGGIWPYLGVGCLTAVGGLVGGGMIAVLIAKVVGAVTKCQPDADTFAPCDWSSYWTWGARIGVILLPVIVLWRMRRARASRKSE
jgi:hypothetical protein